MDLSKAPKFGDDYPQTTANNTNNSPSNGANNINRANNSASGDGISASNSANFENLADNRNFHDNASFAPFSASEEGSFVNDGGRFVNDEDFQTAFNSNNNGNNNVNKMSLNAVQADREARDAKVVGNWLYIVSSK